ncbi:hypothetical protein P170DRAFT_182075 [Aspergillus steynii IBT 23096]|uniref:Uncharacterized protein n=1 Tax=Aspergillus steynii IBT 23096 TaxID=1392250 RepID=A0A2I2G8X6_9EURO|nr:uncharacterized protein P170DRAFT_182075 [Aspergillus steynii IBT 23096]PLB49335.1 hypothetical protein P170DRAFT_182075 [Aspergillus steynii IBT 23096]
MVARKKIIVPFKRLSQTQGLGQSPLGVGGAAPGATLDMLNLTADELDTLHAADGIMAGSPVHADETYRVVETKVIQALADRDLSSITRPPIDDRVRNDYSFDPLQQIEATIRRNTPVYSSPSETSLLLRYPSNIGALRFADIHGMIEVLNQGFDDQVIYHSRQSRSSTACMWPMGEKRLIQKSSSATYEHYR